MRDCSSGSEESSVALTYGSLVPGDNESEGRDYMSAPAWRGLAPQQGERPAIDTRDKESKT